tara:strand:+ start:1410 stop:2768 length:1359 start_codon:yes stop_codon:yes gene_type:complete
LADLSSVRSYNYDKPTICHNFFVERAQWTESKTLFDKFLQQFPFLENIMEDLIVFGGCLVDFLLLRDNEIRDIDILLVENESTQANPALALANRVEKFVEDIKEWSITQNNLEKDKFERHHYSSHFSPKYVFRDLLVTRYKGVYEIKLPWCAVKFQISYCWSLDALKNKIDIGCTQILLKNEEVYIGERAKFEIENLAITIDHKRQYNQYIERVVKYFDKGFDLILPHLDIDKVPSRNLEYNACEILDLPFILVTCYKISKNKIMGNLSLRAYNTQKRTIESKHDWGSGTRKNDVSAIIHDNLCKIARKDMTCLTYWGQGENYKNAFNPSITLTERQLTNTYAVVCSKILTNNTIDVARLEKYYPVRDLSCIMEEMLIQYLRKPGTGVANDDKFADHVKKYMESLTELQMEVTRKFISEAKENCQLELEAPEFSFDKDDSEYLNLWYGIYLK